MEQPLRDTTRNFECDAERTAATTAILKNSKPAAELIPISISGNVDRELKGAALTFGGKVTCCCVALGVRDTDKASSEIPTSNTSADMPEISHDLVSGAETALCRLAANRAKLEKRRRRS